ncbi:hypothetical protein CR513_05125, partial [Mucuna pruriens]
MEALKATEEREEELRRQLVAVKATMEKSGGAAASSATTGTQAFWAQPFSEEIDGTAIPPNFRKVFASRSTASFCAQLKIKQQFKLVEHLQSNRQAKAANKVILKGL